MILPNDIDFTLVVGLDEKHLRQFSWVWRTWKHHKPSLLQHPLIVFYDQESGMDVRQLHDVIKDHKNARVIAWPPENVKYTGDENDKWYHPQRYKMLAGFVHVPAIHVNTPYWLKIDTDVVATGKDNWIDPAWFDDFPAIVSHRWGFTKPADQIILLDRWVDTYADDLHMLQQHPPLNIVPNEGWSRVKHPRIISWCGFFNTAMTKLASDYASTTVGRYQLPVPSQDGYLWYFAARSQYQINRVNMKDKGWEWWSTDKNIREAVERSLGGTIHA